MSGLGYFWGKNAKVDFVLFRDSYSHLLSLWIICLALDGLQTYTCNLQCKLNNSLLVYGFSWIGPKAIFAVINELSLLRFRVFRLLFACRRSFIYQSLLIFPSCHVLWHLLFRWQTLSYAHTHTHTHRWLTTISNFVC